MAKSGFSQQFKPGTYPIEHWDESTRVNGHDVDSPSTVRKRQGVARGSQQEANPGMIGKADYTRKTKRKK